MTPLCWGGRLWLVLVRLPCLPLMSSVISEIRAKEAHHGQEFAKRVTWFSLEGVSSPVLITLSNASVVSLARWAADIVYLLLYTVFFPVLESWPCYCRYNRRLSCIHKSALSCSKLSIWGITEHAALRKTYPTFSSHGLQIAAWLTPLFPRLRR